MGDEHEQPDEDDDPGADGHNFDCEVTRAVHVVVESTLLCTRREGKARQAHWFGSLASCENDFGPGDECLRSGSVENDDRHEHES